MLKILVALVLGAGILLAAAAFVANEPGGLDHDSIVSGTLIQNEPAQLRTISSPDQSPARLVP